MPNPYDDVDDLLAAKKAANEEARDSTQWDPAPGEKIVGVLLKADVLPTRHGPSLLLVIRNTGGPTGGVEEGESASVWAGRTVLRGELMREAPALQSILAIQFEGKIEGKSGGNSYYGYTVIVVDPDDDPDTRNRAMWTDIEDQLEPRKQGGQRTRKDPKNEDGSVNYF